MTHTFASINRHFENRQRMLYDIQHAFTKLVGKYEILMHVATENNDSSPAEMIEETEKVEDLVDQGGYILERAELLVEQQAFEMDERHQFHTMFSGTYSNESFDKQLITELITPVAEDTSKFLSLIGSVSVCSRDQLDLLPPQMRYRAEGIKNMLTCCQEYQRDLRNEYKFTLEQLPEECDDFVSSVLLTILDTTNGLGSIIDTLLQVSQS